MNRLLLLLILCAPIADSAQQYLWARAEGGNREGGALRMNQGTGIRTDDSGNVYACGFFQGIAGFGTDSLRSYMSWNGILIKYDPTGKVLWARQVTDGASCACATMCTDRNHHVIVAGYHSGQGLSTFMAMYDAGGNRLWYKNTDTPYCTAHAIGIATDSKGNIYMAGDCKGTMRLDTFSIGEPEKYTIFLVKYNPAGKITWIRHSQSTNKFYTEIAAIAVDTKDNIWFTGIFDSALTMDKAHLKSKDSTDVFLMKYNTTGTRLQTWTWGSTHRDRASDITTDAQGNIYLTACFMADANVSSKKLEGEQVMKLSPAGKLLWNCRIGKAEKDFLVKARVAVAPGGDVCIAGYAYYNIPLFGEPHYGRGAADIFIAKFTTAGKLLWKQFAGNTGMDECDAICTDPRGNICITGYFHKTLQFGDNCSVIATSGDNGMFVAKMR